MMLYVVTNKGLELMAQRSLRATYGSDENIVKFARWSASNCGATALNLVHQAAEIFSGMEDHARETESRAQSLCKSAVERLKQAEIRTEAAERQRLQIITEVDCKLQDASKALKQAQSRMIAAEDRLTAMEFRAQKAEAEAREAKEALALVEEAIRRRLICASPEAAVA
jgi:SMC interacting uncharacterized protein involved in chromosome segregation